MAGLNNRANKRKPEKVNHAVTCMLLLIICVFLILSGCESKTITEAGTSMAAASERVVEPIPEEELAAVYEKTELTEHTDSAEQDQESVTETEETEAELPAGADASEKPETEADAEQTPENEPEQEPESEVIVEEQAVPIPEELLQPAPAAGGGRVIVIDPGHSANIPSGTEPLGPGSSENKAKDAVGTRGTATGIMEYELVLNVSFLLQNELTARGYTVVLTRTSNSDSISCMERAQVANNAGAAAYIRVHADGAESASAHGASVLCVSSATPYTPSTYAACRRLSEAVITSYCAATGCYNRGVVETDAMSGNNWSRVPTTLIELGFMTNPEEDVLMSSADYQARMVKGIADGIDAYMSTAGE